jgi:C4-dicarboxylate transporter DctM subunit
VILRDGLVRIRHAADDHRHLDPVRLHDVVAAGHAVGGRIGIGELQVNKWLVLAAINAASAGGRDVPAAGGDHPDDHADTDAGDPRAGFDPIWFGVILTINMELGLITPPVGLNLFVINGITPDIKLQTILRGALPFMGCMVVAILLLCVFPGLATWLPGKVMG